MPTYIQPTSCQLLLLIDQHGLNRRRTPDQMLGLRIHGGESRSIKLPRLYRA